MSVDAGNFASVSEEGALLAEREVMVATDNQSDSKGQVVNADNDAVSSIVYAVAKKVAIFGTIYLIGYLGLSVAWLIGPLVLGVVREQWSKNSARRRDIAKACATTDEKDIIIAKISELPAWVYFPDVERCEWVNKVVKQLWPNANHFARSLVKTTIEPNVAEALKKYKMTGFKFDRIILGTIPPRIGGVKVYDVNVSRNEIIMDLDLFYASDCDINFTLAGMKGGIKDFQIHGTVRVVMKPLIRVMPLIGGLQVFFLNNPIVDFNLVGVIDLLDMPGLSDILKRIVVEQIGNVMVLPNKLPIILNDSVSSLELKMPQPEGVLRVHVIEAKDLMKKDVSVLGKGKSDPYAIITIGSQEFRTSTIDGTVNPKWDYWCEAAIYFNDGQCVEVDLFDSDDTSNDEKLGRASIDISSVVRQGLVDSWIVLENARHGMLHVRLTWLTVSSSYDDLKLAFKEIELLGVTSLSTSILSVFVDSAKNLPKARLQSNPDPYVVLTLGKQSEQTAAQLRTDSPVWEQGFSFLVSNPENMNLQIKIIDQKTGIELGHHMFVMNTLLTAKDMSLGSQPFQLQNSGGLSKILVALYLRILKPGNPAKESNNDLASSTDPLNRIDSVESNNKMGALTEARDAVECYETTKNTEEDIELKHATLVSADTLGESSIFDNSNLVHRVPNITTSAGEAKLGRILLSIRYHISRQKLNVIVHKIMNIPLKDPSSIPDPYVKLYLLPSRAKETKRKTIVVKDTCNPTYDSSFEYVISSYELTSTDLEVTVCTQKGFLYGGSPVIGMVVVQLSNPEITNKGILSWYDLQPETKQD